VLMLLFAAVIQDPAASSVATPVDEDPVICRREESEVGTHMRAKKVCMKKSDWTFVEKQTQRGLQRLREHNLDPGKSSPPR
jgi:hypothetical protein